LDSSESEAKISRRLLRDAPSTPAPGASTSSCCVDALRHARGGVTDVDASGEKVDAGVENDVLGDVDANSGTFDANCDVDAGPDVDALGEVDA